MRRAFFILTLLTAVNASAWARIGLLAEEPFGSFGTLLPAGHAAIYLDHICAETPLKLRPCNMGEHGVIISRFHDLHEENFDWLATPALTYLYGTEDPTTLPALITPEFESALRLRYREAHLGTVMETKGRPTVPQGADWPESIGAAFDRRLFLYLMDTTAAQDAAILEHLNDDPNHRRYRMRRANCADFAAGLLNIAFPNTVHRAEWADFDMMSPKQAARRIDAFGRSHPEAHLEVYEIPQLPGTLRRSRPMRGAAETIIKIKRYLATLLVIQPELALATWIIYEERGKWTPGLDAKPLSPTAWEPLLLARGNAPPDEQATGAAQVSTPTPAELTAVVRDVRGK